jgi:ribonucleoside-diphosphate reductase alpha chain
MPDPVDKDAGAAQATVNGSALNGISSNGASLNGSTPAQNHAAPNCAEFENSPEAVLSNGQIRDVFQNERGITVRIDRTRDGLLTEFGKSTLSDRYLMNGGCLGSSKGAAKG